MPEKWQVFLANMKWISIHRINMLRLVSTSLTKGVCKPASLPCLRSKQTGSQICTIQKQQRNLMYVVNQKFSREMLEADAEEFQGICWIDNSLN